MATARGEGEGPEAEVSEARGRVAGRSKITSAFQDHVGPGKIRIAARMIMARLHARQNAAAADPRSRPTVAGGRGVRLGERKPQEAAPARRLGGPARDQADPARSGLPPIMHIMSTGSWATKHD